MMTPTLIGASGLYKPCHLLEDLVGPPELLSDEVFPMVQQKNVVEGLLLGIPMPDALLLKIGPVGIQSRIRVSGGPRRGVVVKQSL